VVYDNIKVKWAKLSSFASSFLGMLCAKNNYNQSMFYKAIQKTKVA